MKKLLFLFIFALLMLPGAMADGISGMHGLAMKHLKIPFYKDKKIQMLIFSDSGQRRGRLMASGNTLLDMILENANVDEIPDGWQTRLYPLNAPMSEVLKFWKPRVKISEAVVFTSSSSIDQANEEVFGDKPVFLRTPMFDLDGEGFRANFRRQIIEVTSNVKIVVRDADLDPRKIIAGGQLPKQQRLIYANSDRLRIDRLNNKIMLIGNVQVIDGRNTLKCDRLTVILDNNASPMQQKNSSSQEKASLDGISRVLADGNVLLIQKPEDPAKLATELQTSESEHLEYDVRREIIILTGDQKNPTLSRGSDTELSGRRIELLRNEDKMFVMSDCRITSLVRDEKGLFRYARRINSDRANFDGKNYIANFHGNVIATDQSATLHTDSLRVHLIQDQKTSSHKIELLFANGRVRIINRSEKQSPESPQRKIIETNTISSRQAELNYRDNKLIFYRDVKVRDSAAALNCNRLDIFLADRENSGNGQQRVSGAPMAAGKEGQNKTVTKLMASGNVQMFSKGDEVRTDLLTLLFRDLPEGAKPSPGMIQSGGVQLIKILCDGSVTATSPTTIDGKTSRRILKAANGMSDLLKDYSEFHGNVNIIDGNTEIFCKDMYIFTGASPINEEIIENVKVKKPQKTPEELEEEALDADPFAVDMGEDSVPTRIAISDSRDLKRIVCQKQVVLLRRDNRGKIQRAGGDRAVYTVNTREVVLTAERPRRPWLRADGRKQFCDIICSDMETQDLRGIGNVVMMPDTEE